MYNEFEPQFYDAKNRVRGPMPRMVGLPTKIGTKESEKKQKVVKNSAKKDSY